MGVSTSVRGGGVCGFLFVLLEVDLGGGGGGGGTGGWHSGIQDLVACHRATNGKGW